jgi:hypothetical protein
MFVFDASTLVLLARADLLDRLLDDKKYAVPSPLCFHDGKGAAIVEPDIVLIERKK